MATKTKTADKVTHPDALNVAADCRRVLREAYAQVQVASEKERMIQDDGQHWVEARNMPDGGHWERNVSPRLRTREERATDVAVAVAEYRHIASLWSVDAG